MIAYEIDPSLHPAELEPEVLDDGFSAPRASTAVAPQPCDQPGPSRLERALAEKSDF